MRTLWATMEMNTSAKSKAVATISAGSPGHTDTLTAKDARKAPEGES